jgi:hypothetical protein
VDPTSLPQPKHLAKATKNLTIGVEKQSIVKVRESSQKPYVATHLNEALLALGVDMAKIAEKVKEQLEATTISLEPVLEPLLDEHDNPMFEEITTENGVLLRPLMRPRLESQGNKWVPVMKAVKKPDYKTNQFALNFFKEVLIATRETAQEGDYRGGVQDAMALAEMLKANPEVMAAIQKEKYIDASFEEVSP